MPGLTTQQAHKITRIQRSKTGAKCEIISHQNDAKYPLDVNVERDDSKLPIAEQQPACETCADMDEPTHSNSTDATKPKKIGKAVRVARKRNVINPPGPNDPPTPSAAVLQSFRKEGRRLCDKRSSSVIDLGIFIEKHRGIAAHGTYLEMLSTEFRIQPRMAQHYCNVAVVFAGHRAFAGLFEPTFLYWLAAPGRRDAIADILRRFDEGAADEAVEAAHALKPNVAPTKAEDITPEPETIQAVAAVLGKLSPDERAILFMYLPSLSPDIINRMFGAVATSVAFDPGA